jgi:heme/copper-type cytochrome/quinol oxidase subunit 2
MKWKETGGVLAVVVVLVGVPLLLWHWRAVTMPHHYPPNSKIITLTAVANGGIWTREEVVGENYWRRTPARVDAIPFNQGDHVVLRLHSADVLHSFAVPILRLGPVDVPAGHTVELEFDAQRSGSLLFLCWQVCSRDHANLQGHFMVKASREDTW